MLCAATHLSAESPTCSDIVIVSPLSFQARTSAALGAPEPAASDSPGGSAGQRLPAAPLSAIGHCHGNRSIASSPTTSYKSAIWKPLRGTPGSYATGCMYSWIPLMSEGLGAASLSLIYRPVWNEQQHQKPFLLTRPGRSQIPL